MLKNFTIENFKCFSQATTVNFGKITVLAGINSVGKSSLIQGLLLVRQIYDKASIYQNTQVNSFDLQLNHVYGLSLGEAERIKSSPDRDDIFFKADNLEFRLHSLQRQPRELSLQCDYPFSAFTKAGGLFSPQFFYLNAERQGPRNYQDILSSGNEDCGIHGEKTFHFIFRHQLERIPDNRRFPSDEKATPTLSKQLEFWMNFIIPGVELNIDEFTELGISRLNIGQPIFDTGFLSPYNFGFGISYVLPIIAEGLLAPEGSLLIVENPEAHLHPCGQSHIGFFLACMAASGVQVVLETHSEHVINGIRIAAMKTPLTHEEICINFFSIDYHESRHLIKQIPLNERMDILEWPEGFLDQEENDLKELRRLRRPQ